MRVNGSPVGGEPFRRCSCSTDLACKLRGAEKSRIRFSAYSRVGTVRATTYGITTARSPKRNCREDQDPTPGYLWRQDAPPAFLSPPWPCGSFSRVEESPRDGAGSPEPGIAGDLGRRAVAARFHGRGRGRTCRVSGQLAHRVRASGTQFRFFVGCLDGRFHLRKRFAVNFDLMPFGSRGR